MERAEMEKNGDGNSTSSRTVNQNIIIIIASRTEYISLLRALTLIIIKPAARWIINY